MKPPSLIELIEQYGWERECFGFEDKYREDVAMEGNHSVAAELDKSCAKQKRKADDVLKKIKKLIGIQ